jgi:hypothetical protein
VTEPFNNSIVHLQHLLPKYSSETSFTIASRQHYFAILQRQN